MLNASYEAINVCTVRRATVLVLKDRAEILEHGQWSVHSENLTFPRPVVIRLVTYVRVPRDAHRRKITRRAVFARDRWSCQYCGEQRNSLTVDHGWRAVAEYTLDWLDRQGIQGHDTAHA